MRVQLLAPSLFSGAGSVFYPTSTVSVNYNSLFMLYSFVEGRGFNLPRGWVGESHMICSFCRFTQASLELADREKWHAPFLSAAGDREAFCGLGVQDFAEFDYD
jgi:hypothetical protein